MARGRLGYKAKKVATRTFKRFGGVKAKRKLRFAKRKANKAGRRFVAKRLKPFRRKRFRRSFRKRRY